MLKLKVISGAPLKLKTKAIIVGLLCSDKKIEGTAATIDKSLSGVLSRLKTSPEFSLAASYSILRPAKGVYSCVIVVNLGNRSLADYTKAVKTAFAKAEMLKINSIACVMPWTANLKIDFLHQIRLIGEQAVYATYHYRKGNVKTTDSNLKEVIVLAPSSKAVDSRKVVQAANQGVAIGEGVNLARHLGEQPPNVCNPAYLVSQTQKLAKALPLKVKVLKPAQLKKLKMGGILSVGQGSANPPRLIIIEYKGAVNKAPIVLVGKGVTFDTGGISLKPGAGMDEMKFDMCGAAATLGTMVSVAKMKLPLNVTAVVPSVENMPGSNAYRPGDVLTMYSGQTVEVLNTDAEGRLILADAITYAEQFKPAEIIDFATLTGACVIALGNHRSGMFATDEKMAKALEQAGTEAGDPCWQLPLDDEYDALLKTAYADMPNIAGGRAAGTITAACFLKRFVKSKRWAHFDIAGTAWGANKRATGRPVPLVATYLARLANKLQ